MDLDLRPVVVVAGVPVWLAACWAFVVAVRAAPRRPPAPTLAGADLAMAGVLGMAGAALVRRLAPEIVGGQAPDRLEAGIAIYSSLAVLAIALAAGVRRVADRGDAIGTRLADAGPGALVGVLGYLAACPVVLGVHWLNLHLILRPNADAPVQEALRQIVGAGDPRQQLVLAAGAVVVIPVLEELIYRGCLQGGFRAVLGVALRPGAASVGATIAAALVFTAVHERFTWLPIFVLGLALGAVYERTRNLWTTVAFHASHNLLTLIWAIVLRGAEGS